MRQDSRVVSSLSLFLGALAVSAGAQDRAAADRALGAMKAAAGAEVSVTRSPRTQLATFLTAPRGGSIPVPDRNAKTPEARALSFLGTYGGAFGLRGADDVLVSRTDRDALGIDHVRLSQSRSGIPVTGGELIVHMRGGGVLSVNGKTLDKLDGVNLSPSVTSLDALGVARRLATERLKASPLVQLSEPRLEIFNQRLLNGRDFPTRLAWFVEAKEETLRELIWIDARSRTVLMHFSQVAAAKNRAVYNGNNDDVLPGTLARSEGGSMTFDPDIDNAYAFTGAAYDYFSNEHQRDSFDGVGGQIKSTVHYCEADCPFPDYFWNGSQLVFGEGFPQADDIVAHEFTHAVIERTANLFSYMQSGALSESYADIFGESTDQTDSLGDDSAPQKWNIGEDLQSGGTVRNMMDPTLFNDPGKLSDPQFFCDLDPVAQDAGGVHHNSGVPNHAFALMVDGGIYNSITVAGIGLTKAAKIQYRALTQYLISSSDFLDNYNALQQACSDLVGTSGITAGNCSEVTKALNAVQMSSVWPCSPTQATPPALCSAGTHPVNSFSDDFESGLGNWTISGPGGYWFRASNPSNPFGGVEYATSGVDSLWGYDRDTFGDARIALASSLPSIPAGARLQFNHSFGFDSGSGANNYDGGVVEYSTNGGGAWTSAAPLFAAGANYNGTVLTTGLFNPLEGMSAFTKDSFGYTASQYNLSTLAGQSSVKFRFRIGTDDSTFFDDFGWFIDDFRVYTCAADAAPTVTTTAATNISQNGAVLNGTVNPNGVATTAYFDYGLTLSYGSQVVVTPSPGSGTSAVPISAAISGLSCNTTYHARAVATNSAGTTNGNDITFLTGQCSPPVVTTVAATGITGTGATLNGTVNPNGGNTVALFDYGTTLSYGSQVTVAPPPGSGLSPVSVSAAVTGLQCNTLYHFRAVATNGGGTTNGGDLTFTTGACLLSISDVVISEGNAGTSNAVFTVTMAAPSGQTVTVSAVTSDQTATAGSDYTATGPLTLTFNPGEVSQTFTVPVLGDTALEGDETFQVTLSSPTNATIADGTGIGTILNDELPSRTFVSESGSDAADCSIQTTPCRNIAGALVKTSPDGEIIILTPGEYETAPLTITKGIKVTSPSGTVAFIRQPITVNAPGGRVVLRGLTLKGAGAGAAITLTAANLLSIEDVTVDRWTNGLKLSNTIAARVTILNSIFRTNTTGIADTAGGPVNVLAIEESRFEGNGTGVEVLAASAVVRESAFFGNTTNGLSVGPGVADVQRSEFTLNGTAVAANAGGAIRVSRLRIFGNAVGLFAAGGSSLQSSGTNAILGNVTDTAGTIGAFPEQ